jgi:hypothetical protein
VLLGVCFGGDESLGMSRYVALWNECHV